MTADFVRVCSLQTYGAKVDQVTAPFGESVSASAIEEALSKKKYKLVTLTHVDTSTGVLSDPKQLSDIVKRVSPDTLVRFTFMSTLYRITD